MLVVKTKFLGISRITCFE